MLSIQYLLLAIGMLFFVTKGKWSAVRHYIDLLAMFLERDFGSDVLGLTDLFLF